MEDHHIKQLHVDAFGYANEVATAVDASHGDDFKTAFVAALLMEAKRRQLTVAPALDPEKGKRKKPKQKRRHICDMRDGGMTTEVAALYLSMPVKKFEKLRAEGRGPKGARASYNGRTMWIYMRDELDAFKASQQADTEA
jgi:hypothetical protein